MTEPRLISAGRRDERVVAVTFDDGPSHTTPEVLDVLESFSVRATFFVIGERVKLLPEIVRDAAARGHEIGNHTWTHINANRTRALETLRDEVERTSALIDELTGSQPKLMRPPYGSDPGRFARASAACGLAATVLWSVQSFDFEETDPDAIVTQVLAEAEPGAIVLLHDGLHGTDIGTPRRATLAALPAVLERLRADGYEFATVSELVGA